MVNCIYFQTQYKYHTNLQTKLIVLVLKHTIEYQIIQVT